MIDDSAFKQLCRKKTKFSFIHFADFVTTIQI